MKTLEQACAPAALRDDPGLTRFADQFGHIPGLLPRGAETFDWRVVADRLRLRAGRDRDGAKGLTAERDRAILNAHADAMETAAQEVEAEAKRKGLA